MFNGQVDLFQSLMLPHVAPSVPNFAHFASSDFCFGGHAKVTKNRRLNLILDGVSVKNQGSDSNSLRQNHPWFFLMEQGYDFWKDIPQSQRKEQRQRNQHLKISESIHFCYIGGVSSLKDGSTMMLFSRIQRLV